MGEVVDMFTRQTIPAATVSDFVSDFIEHQLGDLIATMESLHEAETEEQFRYYLNDIREQVAGWPK